MFSEHSSNGSCHSYTAVLVIQALTNLGCSELSMHCITSQLLTFTGQSRLVEGSVQPYAESPVCFYEINRECETNCTDRMLSSDMSGAFPVR